LEIKELGIWKSRDQITMEYRFCVGIEDGQDFDEYKFVGLS